MRAFALGRGLVGLLVVVAGLILLAIDAVKNALNYTELWADVVRVEEVCIPPGASAKQATNCIDAQARSAGRRLPRHIAVHVRYTSPADGRVHEGTLLPVAGRKAVEASRLRPGYRWKIYAHDDIPDEIKAE